jgi:hypothetical protein
VIGVHSGRRLTTQKRDRAREHAASALRVYSGMLIGDITVYNVATADRQDFNIIAMMKNAVMDKGQSVTVTGPPQLRVV